jgi:hypothetical protein
VGVDDDLLRLEAVLAKYPEHRALPDVQTVLDEAGVDASALLDERARKLLEDALFTRPHGRLDSVTSLVSEVEMLVLEVRELTAALRAGSFDAEGFEHVDHRLAWARRRLADLRGEL